MATDTAAWTCCGVTYKGGTECPKCLTPKPTTAAAWADRPMFALDADVTVYWPDVRPCYEEQQ